MSEATTQARARPYVIRVLRFANGHTAEHRFAPAAAEEVARAHDLMPVSAATRHVSRTYSDGSGVEFHYYDPATERATGDAS